MKSWNDGGHSGGAGLSYGYGPHLPFSLGWVRVDQARKIICDQSIIYSGELLYVGFTNGRSGGYL